MVHRPLVVAEIRELPPQDGWACYERTGRACLVCHCGLNTGFIDKAETARLAQQHRTRKDTPCVRSPRLPPSPRA